MQHTAAADDRSSGKDRIDTRLLWELLGLAAFCLCVWGALALLIWSLV